MLAHLARLAIGAPRRLLTAAAMIAVAAVVIGLPAAKHLCACGFEDPTSDSTAAAHLLTDTFGQGDVQMVIVVESPAGYRSAAVRDVALSVVDQLRGSPHVAAVTSPWTDPPAAAAGLVSEDGTAGLIVAGITGGESRSQEYAKALSEQITGDRGSVTVRSGGTAMANVQITEQSQHDLLLMESIAIPLSFVVLVWVFGGLLAAAVPVAVGGFAILGALAVLRAVTLFTDVSIFALNLSAAMGLALAIDYTLLIISRYRDELAGGAVRTSALTLTMVSAGRTVSFSATTVALSMGVLALFPMHFLRSFAYAGVATVAFAALAAVVLTPAAITLLGDRLDALDARRLARRVLGRPEPVPRPVEQWFWYRSTTFVMRRAAPIGAAVVVLLLTLGAPFLGVKWGFPDDRVLPTSASAHRVGDQLRDDFTADTATAVSVVIPDANSLPPKAIQRYAEELAHVPDVVSVTPTGEVGGGVLLTVDSSAPLFSDRSDAQLDRLHAVPGPGDRPVYIGGTAQTNRDSVHAITSRLPVVLGLIGLITFVLLLALTGSVVIPLKALLLNVLSLTAAFGAMVWIFQDGHLGAFGTTATGTLVANVPVLLFCIAFGLSMDYEVFLVSRIREFWLASCALNRTPRRRNDESVALGIAHTGRVVTAAALVMAISFAALIAANVSFMRMFGLGLTLAVLVDATLVRMVLLPAFMHLMGGANWWAPTRMTRLPARRDAVPADPAPVR